MTLPEELADDDALPEELDDALPEELDDDALPLDDPEPALELIDPPEDELELSPATWSSGTSKTRPSRLHPDETKKIAPEVTEINPNV